MNDPINQLGTWAHDVALAISGILFAGMAMVGANYPVDILQYHLIVFNAIYITVQDIFTIAGAIAGLIVAFFSVIKIIHHLKTELKRPNKPK